MEENNPLLHRRRETDRYVTDAHAFLILDKTIKKGIKLKNISAGGVCACIDSSLEVESRAEVVLLYPFFEDFVTRDSRVAWCKPINTGMWEFGLDFSRNKIDLSKYVRLSSSQPLS